ncbi:extracellular solute-binding protein [Sinomonas halotolerans]|uniref:Extracellular solute-binding protein n=1 Tax=Sinomonas halotolerans TaxID=1644133 RepID=A0ABU9WXP2_9MICC
MKLAELDPASRTPLYEQLKEALVAAILEGRFGTDGQLPTEHDLCEQLGISRNPVHRALAELFDEGVIIRQRRRGTFVNPAWITRQLSDARVRVTVPTEEWANVVRSISPAEIILDVQVVPFTELHRHVLAAVAAGEAPDLAVLDSVWVPQLAALDALHPVDSLDPEWVETTYRADVARAFIEATSHEGHIVAVQAEADVAGLWYDRESMARVGFVHAPATLRELRQAARACLDAFGHPPIAVPAGPDAAETATYVLHGWLCAHGASVIEHEQVVLAEPPAVRAVRALSSLVKDGLIDAASAGWGRTEALESLVSGLSQMALGGSYDLAALARLTGLSPAQVLDRFGFAPLPSGTEAGSKVLAGGLAYAVFRQARQPHLAMRIVRRLMEATVQLTVADTTGQLPSRVSVASVLERGSGFLHDVARLLPEATTRPAVPEYERVSVQLRHLLAGVVSGGSVPREVRRAAEGVAAVTGLELAS